MRQASVHRATPTPTAPVVKQAPGCNYDLYFELTEGVGGEYARQAWLARSTAEVDEWLNRCAGIAAPLWLQMARLTSRHSSSGAHQKDRTSSGDAATAPITLLEALLNVHSVRYRRDNLTDVFEG